VSRPTLHGEIAVDVTIDRLGEVKDVTAQRSSGDAALDWCVRETLRGTRFPAPATGDARFSTSFTFVPDQGVAANDPQGDVPPGPPIPGGPTPPSNVPQAAPYEGRFKVVMDHLGRGEKDAAFEEANKWRAEQPGDVMALVALGEVMEAKGDIRTAARAYGSILELFSARADSRRFAGERLERLKDQAALRLAADSYGKAVEQRPDHPASHRLYAFTLLKLGEYEKAFEALKVGAARRYPPGRFAGAPRILAEDLGLAASAWAHAQPNRAGEIEAKLRAAGGTAEHDASLRFVLVWETDANDVDFHIYDARGGHAYYGTRDLPSGGSLYADVTTGYGPECFTIRGARDQRAYPYTLQAHYYSRGPMGYGMGKLEIVEHDGKGNLTFEERPFVVMQDRAYVDLGTVDREKPAATASLK
jgi:TonB family protein